MDSQTEKANRRLGRCWRFGTAVLDERSWTLRVNGQETQIEAKPMELLHVLVLRAGETVSKEELLAAVWPGVSVVEASLATAMLKVRKALGEEGAAAILTVPRIGYKLAVPVEQAIAAGPIEPPGRPEATPEPLPAAAARQGSKPVWRWRLAAAALLATGAAGASWLSLQHSAPADRTAPVELRVARDALRRLDVSTIESLLRAGWNPNTPFDSEGNAALQTVVQVCEWHPAHDRQQLQLTVKTLLDGGARPATRNVWGDTAYSIASAKRFCGPDHPVVHLLHVACYTGPAALGDQCLADYAHAKGIGQDGRRQGALPP